MAGLNVPVDVSETLRRAFGPDLDRAALEALAIEGYRTARLTAGEVARVLGLETSIAAQKWLAQHGRIEDSSEVPQVWRLGSEGSRTSHNGSSVNVLRDGTIFWGDGTNPPTS